MSAECVAAGVEMATASTPADTRSASEPTVAAPGCSRLSSSRRSVEEVTTATRSHSAAAASSGAWKYRPPKPYPTSPNRTGSISLVLLAVVVGRAW